MTTQDSSRVGADTAHSQADCCGAGKKSGTSPLRTFVTFGALALAVFALWYDYKVARPAVETAYNTIEQYNNDVNTTAGRKYLTEAEIQEKLQRAPSHSYTKGEYTVEEYGYASGIPLRSHKYFAVYQAGTPLVFLKHFKFALPPDELETSGIGAVGAVQAWGDNLTSGDVVTDGQMPTPAGDPEPAAQGESAADVPPVDGPARSAAAEEKAASETPAGEKAAAPEKSPAEDKPVEKEAGEAAPAKDATGDAEKEAPVDSATPK